MKINKIRAIGAEVLDFPFRGGDRFIFKGADGLGPTEVQISLANTRYGVHYQSRRPQHRQVRIRLGLDPDYFVGETVDEMRTEIYGLLTPRYGRPCSLQFLNDDDVQATVDAYIKAIDPVFFSQENEVQLSFECLSEDLFAEADETLVPEIVTDPSAEEGETFFEVTNRGTSYSGFRATFKFDQPSTGEIQISDSDPFGEKIILAHDFNADEALVVDTRAESRGIWKMLPATSDLVSVLSGLDGRTTWLQLHTGVNRLKINREDFHWPTDGFVMRPKFVGV